MRSASALFGETDRQDVARAVAEAESGTTAEIVPIVSTSSGRYDRAEDFAGFLSALAVFIVGWLLFQREVAHAGGWDGLPLTLQLPVLVLILIAGFAIGALAAARVAWLRRLLTPARELTDEVATRAGQLFFDQRIHHTSASTGVLIYISLFERRATVLADEAVIEAIGADAVRKACEDLTAELRRADVPTALAAAITRIGAQLAEALPRDDLNDANELSDALILID